MCFCRIFTCVLALYPLVTERARLHAFHLVVHRLRVRIGNVSPAGYSRTEHELMLQSDGRCFFIRGELCDGGGAPACITSLEEQAQASALSVAPLEVFVSQIGSLWVGNHQPDSLSGARCLDGSTAALPSSSTANQYATCTLLYTGELVPTICNSRTMKLHRCLCDANATVASDALGFLAAWDETDMILRGRISLVTLLIMLILAPLPVLIVRCCRCCRGARSAGTHTAKCRTVVVPPSVRATLNRPSRAPDCKHKTFTSA